MICYHCNIVIKVGHTCRYCGRSATAKHGTSGFVGAAAIKADEPTYGDEHSVAVGLPPPKMWPDPHGYPNFEYIEVPGNRNLRARQKADRFGRHRVTSKKE